MKSLISLLACLLLLALDVVIGREAQAQPQKPLRIMCIGASITMGQGVNGGYRLPLEKMFEGAGIPVEFVGRVGTNSKGMTWPFHDGYPGHRIDQIENGATNTFGVVSQPIADGVKALHPDLILLLCGTNDVRQNYRLDEAPQRFDHLIGTLQSADAGVRILVGNLTPDLHYDDAVRTYNAGIANVVAKRLAAGQKVGLVDHYATFNAGTDISADRTHPNAGGYVKLARNWFRALEPNAPQVAFTLSAEGANSFAGQSCSGYQITMKSSSPIVELGFYTAGQPLTGRHSVVVFSADGHKLASVEFTPDDKPSGIFCTRKLAVPLKLDAGKPYVFASNNVGLPTLIGTEAVVDPLSLDGARFYFDHNVAVRADEKNEGEVIFPGTTIHDINGGVGYFGPIFCLEPVKAGTDF